MSKWLSAIPVVVLVAGASNACATKGYVNNQVTGVNDKVETLSTSVEQNEERTRRNEAAIGVTDQKAQAAQGAAGQAQQAAGAADAKAGRAGARADEAIAMAENLDQASRKLVFSVVLSEDQGSFAFGKTELPMEAKGKLDEMVTQLKADPQAVYFEIEGYTDSVGPKEINDRIGLQRAEAVKRYLFEQHQIPLHKMNVISYGMDKPVASNKTREGRAQNRRVVIRVLA